MSLSDPTPFTAVILAADRGTGDPVARGARVACKAFSPINGTPMILGVLQALTQSREVTRQVLCGPSWSLVETQPELLARISAGTTGWLDSRPTPSASAYYALNTLLPEHQPVLLTTADHALLTAEMVDYFSRQARASSCDVVIGLTDHDAVSQAYPRSHRTALRFKGESCCGCNLFAFLTRRASEAANFWRRIEAQRKQPYRLMREIGLGVLLRYQLRQLSLDDALARLSRLTGLTIGAVRMPFPAAALDVDSMRDLDYIQDLMRHAQ